MYQGKHCNRKRNRKFRKSALLLVSMMVLLTAVLGGTVAYLFTNTDDVENTFTPVKVSTTVDEKINSGVKEHVKIKNTGDISAYIRAAVVINWQTSDGKVYGESPKPESDYAISYNDTDWEAIGDFWYHIGTVASGGETSELIISCAPTDSGKSRKDDEGNEYFLTVTILGSAVQSTPDDAVKEAWKMSFDSETNTWTAVPQGG